MLKISGNNLTLEWKTMGLKYLTPSETYVMEHFCENSYWLIPKMCSIIDVKLGSKNASAFCKSLGNIASNAPVDRIVLYLFSISKLYVFEWKIQTVQ